MAVSANTRKGGWLETATIVIEALAIAMVVRTFLYQPFNIPSGSMKETLLVGDYLFVSKLSYGYSRYSFYNFIPFNGPHLRRRAQARRRRRVQAAARQLYRLHQARHRAAGRSDRRARRRAVHQRQGSAAQAHRRLRHPGGRRSAAPIPAYEETLPNGVKYTVLDSEEDGPFDNVGPYKVPAGHYFMMGDNRDNSTDSRASWGVGYVPFDNLIGRAEIIFFSAAVDEPDAFRWWSPWTWPFDIRWNRFFKLVR